MKGYSCQLAGVDPAFVVDAHQSRLFLQSKSDGFRFSLSHAEVRFQFQHQLPVSHAPYDDSRLIHRFLNHESVESLFAAATFLFDSSWNHLAHQSRHKSAQALATPGGPHTEEDLHLPEEFTQEQEEQQESDEFQEPYAVGERSFPSWSSAPMAKY
jgi:hypothetical protein